MWRRSGRIPIEFRPMTDRKRPSFSAEWQGKGKDFISQNMEMKVIESHGGRLRHGVGSVAESASIYCRH